MKKKDWLKNDERDPGNEFDNGIEGNKDKESVTD